MSEEPDGPGNAGAGVKMPRPRNRISDAFVSSVLDSSLVTFAAFGNPQPGHSVHTRVGVSQCPLDSIQLSLLKSI